MATKYDQSSATRPVSIRSHTSAFQVHFKHTSSALEMSSVNPPSDPKPKPGASRKTLQRRKDKENKKCYLSTSFRIKVAKNFRRPFTLK